MTGRVRHGALHRSALALRAFQRRTADGLAAASALFGGRRFALVVRLPDSARTLDGLAQMLIETPRMDSDTAERFAAEIVRQNGLSKTVVGATTIEEVLRVTREE